MDEVEIFLWLSEPFIRAIGCTFAIRLDTKRKGNA